MRTTGVWSHLAATIGVSPQAILPRRPSVDAGRRQFGHGVSAPQPSSIPGPEVIHDSPRRGRWRGRTPCRGRRQSCGKRGCGRRQSCRVQKSVGMSSRRNRSHPDLGSPIARAPGHRPARVGWHVVLCRAGRHGGGARIPHRRPSGQGHLGPAALRAGSRPRPAGRPRPVRGRHRDEAGEVTDERSAPSAAGHGGGCWCPLRDLPSRAHAHGVTSGLANRRRGWSAVVAARCDRPPSWSRAGPRWRVLRLSLQGATGVSGEGRDRRRGFLLTDRDGHARFRP